MAAMVLLTKPLRRRQYNEPLLYCSGRLFLNVFAFKNRMCPKYV